MKFDYAIIAVVGIVAVVFIVAIISPPDQLFYDLIIKGNSYEIYHIETTPAEWQQGLMNQTITNQTMMLFIFPEDNQNPFWMMNMQGPIDLIWFDNHGKVVGMIPGAPPCHDARICTLYSPESPAIFVLETWPGFIKANNLSVGMQVLLQEKSQF